MPAAPTQDLPQRRGPALALPLQHVLYARLRELAPSAFDVQRPTPEHIARDQAFRFELEQLPYNLGASHHGICQLELLLRALGSEFPEPAQSTETIIHGVGPEKWQPIAWSVDSFLDAARRAQNALTRYVARTFRVSLPQSLSDLAKDTTKYANTVPADVLELITSYWTSAGSEPKAYRDLTQHYAIVSSDIYVLPQPGGLPRIHLLLPTLPGERSLQRLSYEPPYVHAGPWCRAAFMSLFAVSYSLQWVLFRRFEYSERAISEMMRHPITAGALGAFCEPPQANLDDELWERRAQLRPSLQAKYGKLEDPPIADG